MPLPNWIAQPFESLHNPHGHIGHGCIEIDRFRRIPNHRNSPIRLLFRGRRRDAEYFSTRIVLAPIEPVVLDNLDAAEA
jgi:hypothetical protein